MFLAVHSEPTVESATSSCLTVQLGANGYVSFHFIFHFIFIEIHRSLLVHDQDIEYVYNYPITQQHKNGVQ